jgi:hypothetical protein
LQGTELARAYVGTIRLKLFKIGAVILKNTRRIRFLLASGCPYKELYFLVAHRLAVGRKNPSGTMSSPLMRCT